METGNGNESLAELVDTIKGTIKNLENKRSFLEEQRPLYEQIFDRINSADTSEDSEETWQFGEVIFQGGKFFQNIGYDYYVEKSREECLEFIVVRINLIKEAIEQFEQKLKEARDTLKNMELLQKDADSLKGELLENEHGEQLMEIREELDEDGNVLNSSVTAANGPRKEGKAAPEQSDTSTQSDAKSDAPDSLDTVEEQESVNTEAHTTETEYLEDQDSFKISQEQMYTFDDLVEQLDKIDEDEDGEFDVNDVQYDYDAYEGINDEYVDYEDDDDDDDDDDDFNDDDSAWDSVDDESDSESFDERSFVRTESSTKPALVRPSLLSSLFLNKPERLMEEQAAAKDKSHDDKKPSPAVQPSPLAAAKYSKSTTHLANSRAGNDENGEGNFGILMSPRTTRRNMLASELSESVRRDLLRERKQLSHLVKPASSSDTSNGDTNPTLRNSAAGDIGDAEESDLIKKATAFGKAKLQRRSTTSAISATSSSQESWREDLEEDIKGDFNYHARGW